MDKTRNRRKSKTPISTKDFQAGLDRNEKTFQAKMLEIFKKFDRPFVNDYIINIEDFTFETPHGRRKWNFEINLSDNASSDSIVSAEHIKETGDFEEANLTVSEGEQCSDQTCTTLVQWEEDNPYYDDREKPVSTQNSGSSFISKIISVGLPLKARGYKDENRFMKSKENALKYPGRYNAAICAADDSGPSENEETSYCDQTLEDIYPQMIETLSNLWNFSRKNQAADNIVRFYKKQVFCKNKKELGKGMMKRHIPQSLDRTYTIHSSESKALEVAAYDSTVPRGKSTLRETIKVHNPTLLSQMHNLNSCAFPVHADPQNYAARTFDGNLGIWTTCIDSTIPEQRHKGKIGGMSPGYRTSPSSSPCKMYISPSKSITSKHQMDIETAQSSYCKDAKLLQQKMCTLSRRNSFSELTLLQSPKTVVAKPNYNISERTLSPGKAMTTRSWMDTDGRSDASYNTKHLQTRTCSLVRRNSFSAFSVHHREHVDFESLYRNLTQSRPQPDLSLSKAPVQLSQTVCSLVNSPGSRRAKRPLGHDSSFSLSKKPRSLTEAIKWSSNFVGGSNMLWSGSSSSHSKIASALPTHMLPYSPMSLRSFSPGVNGRSPERTNARVYRKLSYQEKNGSVTGN